MRRTFAILGFALLCIGISSQSTSRGAQATDAELAAIAETLWTLDENNVARLVRINVQEKTNYQGTDNAPAPLLTVQAAAYQKPTISKLIALEDNYFPAASKAEVVTAQESLEEAAFLDAIFATPVMKRAEEFLVDKGYIVTRKYGRDGKVTVNRNAFREAFQEIWFGLYTREKNVLGSSGFEHVFVGETKNGEVSGFHNWVQFSKQETANSVNYNGQFRVLRLGPKGMVLKHNFKWNGVFKPVTSMFIGTSPEFEMALYTICYYARPGTRCPVKVGGKSVPITTHYINRQGKRYLATAFPDI